MTFRSIIMLAVCLGLSGPVLAQPKPVSKAARAEEIRQELRFLKDELDMASATMEKAAANKDMTLLCRTARRQVVTMQNAYALLVESRTVVPDIYAGAGGERGLSQVKAKIQETENIVKQHCAGIG
ncbi:hypothetical protein PQU92_12055 [Asticcacaulis sp. BYS171W]|uniref:UrcA family protein n=1 Tax=Asticcacaulis aquaticus TaxID=2984212 RepID=A0ABT5HVC7_9CAUL|nr:hypothetical protein [Asticcacaulis aquaticus]MDC7684013.1 hypothetical protein [Asticcacaulis aquaticus]